MASVQSGSVQRRSARVVVLNEKYIYIALE
jgi:hypothetical protein